MPSAIPIQNVYYLLIYAWDRLAEGALVDISAVEGTELVDLYAAVLIAGVHHLSRRGLDQGYLPVTAEIAGIRGRVQIAETTRRMLTQHGRAACAYDELSVDTLPNRILRATIQRLSRAENLDKTLRGQLTALDRSLAPISELQLSKQSFRRIQLHGNNGFYRFLMNLCELILDSSLATEADGRVRFRDFVRDPDKMATLFERFVFNFCRLECPDSEVTRERIYWAAKSQGDPDLNYLPTMQTDVSIRRPGRTLILDAKYYQQTFQRHFESETVHSANLYQLYAYLKNLEARGGWDAKAEGMLLYPAVAEKVRLSYDIDGHTLRVCTLDLARSWSDIKAELLELVL